MISILFDGLPRARSLVTDRVVNGRQHAALFLFVLVALVLAALPARAIDVREHTTPAGLSFWMVEDYTVPIVTLSFEFSGGASQDPAGKAGLASLMAAMMDEGAGDLTTAELKAQLEAKGIEIGFSAGRDSIGGGMRVLASDAGFAFERLADMLNRPRFEEASLERIRAGFIQSAQRSLRNPGSMMADTMRAELFGDHPYGRDVRGNAESLATITRDDIAIQHRKLMARGNLIIGVVGAASPEEIAGQIDRAFAGLPANAELEAVSDIEPDFGFVRHVESNTPKTIVALALPGLKRSDPDFFTAHLMNHILGGGSFSSRLYNEIRERRGLVYGVGSDINSLAHAAYISAGFETGPERAAEALSVMLEEIGKMAAQGPTQEELEAARKYVLGSYAINNLDTSSKIADVLVALQAEDLPMDYIDSRRDRIGEVTLEGIREMARRLLSVQPGIVTVGPAPVVLDAATR